MARPTVPNPRLRAAVRELVTTTSQARTAKALDVSYTTVSRIIAALPCQVGTLVHVEQQLEALKP